MTSSTPTFDTPAPGRPAGVATARSAPTYGELVEAAHRGVAEACTRGSGPFPEPAASLTAAINYERLLAVGGRHLRLLTTHPNTLRDQGEPARLSLLVERLAGLDHDCGGPDLWGRAATQLAAAHDLLATHLGPAGARRTPEAELLDDPAVRDAAAARVLALVRPALGRSDQLLAHAREAQRGRPAEPGVDRSRATHLRQATRALHRLLTDLPARPSSSRDVLAELDALTPALPRITERPATGLDTSLEALRVLRLLAHRQTLGHEQASPGCLHDLTRLAVVTTRAAQDQLPQPATPLARVQLATACDELHAARHAWEHAAAALGQHVQGLTKAPRLYADAVRTATAAVPHDATLTAAVLAALPRFGREAGTTLERLSEAGSLAVATKTPGRFQASWRLLEPSEARDIADRFAAAGRASHRARATYLQVTRPARTERRHRLEPGSQVRRPTLTVEGLAR